MQSGLMMSLPGFGKEHGHLGPPLSVLLSAPLFLTGDLVHHFIACYSHFYSAIFQCARIAFLILSFKQCSCCNIYLIFNLLTFPFFPNVSLHLSLQQVIFICCLNIWITVQQVHLCMYPVFYLLIFLYNFKYAVFTKTMPEVDQQI